MAAQPGAVGKTWALLLEPIRHIHDPKFAAVVFRREMTQITNPGALWDKTYEVYPKAGGKPRLGDYRWVFPSRASITFKHLEHEDDKLKWQGTEVPLFCFDELTHYTESQFFYVAMSRGRSMSTVIPYVRGSCNPDALSWVKVFLAPWVDKNAPLKAESGDILWMFRREDVILWYRTRQEAIDDNIEALPVGIDPKKLIKSVTFVAASVYDNKKLLEINPEYVGGLLALPLVERKRLLEGDWDVVASAGKVFNRVWFELVDADAIPSESTAKDNRTFDVRFWDFAATVPKQKGDDPDWTVGTKMRRCKGVTYVLDVVRGRWTPGDLDLIVKNVATQDGRTCAVRWEEEGGSSGKVASAHISDVLTDVVDDARPVRPQGDKVTRAQPFAAASESGKVKVKRAEWNEGWLTELHHFPDASHDDQCFVAGTMIATPRGDCPIETFRAGDRVLTPFGSRRVLAAGLTGMKPVIKYGPLVGTSNHPIFTYERGFVPMHTLNSMNSYDILSHRSLSTWMYQRLLSSMASPTISWAVSDAITLVSQQPIMAGSIRRDFMSRFGSFITAKKYHQAVKFTTLTMTHSIMTRATWSAYRCGNTVRSLFAPRARRTFDIWSLSDHLPQRGTQVTKAGSGTSNTARTFLVTGQQLLRSVLSVAQSFLPSIPTLVTVPGNAETAHVITLLNKSLKQRLLVSSAVSHSLQEYTGGARLIEKPVHTLVVDALPVKLDGLHKVYNLTVEDTPAYYANGLLVHNCDSGSGAYTYLARYAADVTYGEDIWG